MPHGDAVIQQSAGGDLDGKSTGANRDAARHPIAEGTGGGGDRHLERPIVRARLKFDQRPLSGSGCQRHGLIG